MSLHVIGTGFGRTGTLSLKYALEQLGFGPCYHMIETRQNPDHDAKWLGVATGALSDWRAILDGYRSSVDWPTIFVWKDLVAAYPDAKVILTVRDPESWYESAAKTIFQRMQDYAADEASVPDPRLQMHRRMVNAIVMDNTFGGDLRRDHAIGVFKAHNEEVQRIVPADRLLIYEAGQGWKPLCGFLGAPAPATAYPKVNSSEDFAAGFLDRS